MKRMQRENALAAARALKDSHVDPAEIEMIAAGAPPNLSTASAVHASVRGQADPEESLVMFGTSLARGLEPLLKKQYANSKVYFEPGGHLTRMSKIIESTLNGRATKPSKIVLIIVGNDCHRNRSLNKIKQDYENILTLIRRLCPTTVIFSCLIPPTRDSHTNGRIHHLNGFIWNFARGQPGVFALAPAVLDKRLFTWDRHFQCFVHLNFQGRKVFVDNLMGWLNGPFQVIGFLNQT